MLLSIIILNHSVNISILAKFYTGLAVFYLDFGGQHIYCHPGSYQVIPPYLWNNLCGYLELQYFYETATHPDPCIKLAAGVYIRYTWIWHVP